MSNGYTSDPSRRRVVRTAALVVGVVLGVVVGWLLFIVISWMFGLGDTRNRDVEDTTAAPVERTDTGSSVDPYDPYGDLAMPASSK